MVSRCRVGKITHLRALLQQYHGAIEADLLDKGVDLLDLWRGDLSWRRVKILIDHLPPESALHRALGVWPRTNNQLADIYDLVAVAGRVKENAGSKKPAKATRPGDDQRAREEQAARTDRARAHRERKSRGGQVNPHG